MMIIELLQIRSFWEPCTGFLHVKSYLKCNIVETATGRSDRTNDLHLEDYKSDHNHLSRRHSDLPFTVLITWVVVRKSW